MPVFEVVRRISRYGKRGPIENEIRLEQTFIETALLMEVVRHIKWEVQNDFDEVVLKGRILIGKELEQRVMVERLEPPRLPLFDKLSTFQPVSERIKRIVKMINGRKEER